MYKYIVSIGFSYEFRHKVNIFLWNFLIFYILLTFINTIRSNLLYIYYVFLAYFLYTYYIFTMYLLCVYYVMAANAPEKLLVGKLFPQSVRP